MQFSKFCFYLTILFFITLGCKKSTEPTISAEFQKAVFNGYEPLWKLYLESAKGGWKNNDNGRFTNDDAPALRSMLELYSVTNDRKYLDTFKRIADTILAYDDVKRAVQDVIRSNRILPGWSSTRYTPNNVRTIFIANDALILLPLLKYHNEIGNKENGALYNSAVYVQRAQLEFNEVFSECWKEVSSSEGYFQDKYYESIGLNMPINQICTMGMLCLELFKATGNTNYLKYAVKSATHVKNKLSKINDAYVWYYKTPSINYPEKVYDDFSHAQLVILFAIECSLNGIVFNQTDINFFVNTFLEQVMDGNKVNFYFGGNINETTPLPANARYVDDPWLTYYYYLTPSNLRVKDKLVAYNSTKRILFNPLSDYNHIGEFVLLHYALHLKYI